MVKMIDMKEITLDINQREQLVAVEPRQTLVDVIREQCGLTGTHVGCEHGVCGACTVLVDDVPVRGCLMFAVQAEGQSIRTIESVADGATLHSLQRAFRDNHALQCGFCTPGFIMLILGMLETETDPSDADIVDILSSNLCRCTGYKNIVAAVRQFLAERALGDSQ